MGQMPIYLYLWDRQSRQEASDTTVTALAKDYIHRNEEVLSIDPRDASQFLIVRDAKGKPYFTSMPGLHFSLSHSGSMGACAFHRDSIGLDIQIHASVDKEKIAKRFFHPQEYAYLEKEAFLSFFQVWVAKESYVKYTGEGISSGLNSFSVVEKGRLRDRMGSVCFYHQKHMEQDKEQGLQQQYSLCLCADEIPGICVIDEREMYLPFGYSRI